MTSFFKVSPEFRNGFKCKQRLALVAMMGCVLCKILELKQKTRSEVHHLIGCGLGKKASDLLTIDLCNFHHVSGGNGQAIHATPLKTWESKYFTQLELLKRTNVILGCEEQYKEYCEIIEPNK